MKLFCLPYAGGSSSIFHNWKPYLIPEIELIPIELAGRGKRIHEQPYGDVNAAVEDVFQIINQEMDGDDFSFFGHSMGAMIVYELTRKLWQGNIVQPKHVFFSGRSAPHIKNPDDKIFHLMADADFKREVADLGGTPPEFFEHPELLKVFIPLLKNDFKLSEQHRASYPDAPLPYDITVFLGKEDDLTAEECHEWRIHTNGICNIHYLNGGHFFLNEEKAAMLKIINQRLLEYLE